MSKRRSHFDPSIKIVERVVKHPLLIKHKNSLNDFMETRVEIPRENGFPYGIHQSDIDCFFAELGYAEAMPMPLRMTKEGLLVYVNPSYGAENFYKEVGFATPSLLPYKVKNGGLVVLSCLSYECMQAGYAQAESVERDDVPF